MNPYIITPVNGQPDWEKIPVMEVSNHQWLPQTDIKMQAQVCYDKTGLYIHLKAVEKHIRAELNAPLCEICEDSCMEFFFRPQEDDLRYFNVEINPNCCTYLGYGINLPELMRLAPENEEAMMEKTARRTPDGWEVFFKYPICYIRVFYPGYELTPGKKIYGNCYKCGDQTVQPHFITWSKIDSPEPCFHKPEDFGLMILG